MTAIRQAELNGVYGSALGMFHLEAQTTGSGDTFNFVVVRESDSKIVNRKTDAELLLLLLSRQREAVRK